MKEIALTQGKIALVDDEDYEYLNQFKWYALKQSKTYYAVRFTNDKVDRIRMHRLIMKCPKGMLIDHINHNGLDNRRENLRICTQQENLWNSLKPKNGKKSIYKGVRLKKPYKDTSPVQWEAKIGLNHGQIYLGMFHSEKEAALAYNRKAIELYGEFANLNIIN